MNDTDNNTVKKSKLYFITFGCKTYFRSVVRLCEEVKQLNIFDEIIGYGDTDLKKDILFWGTHGNFIKHNKKGYGYWLWKSYLNKKLLEKINNNDIVLYCDAGCKINNNEDSIKRLNEYIEIVKNSDKGILSFSLDLKEQAWTKMDLFECLNCYDDLKETNQLVGGIFIYKKCEHTISLINKWYETSSIYHLIDDSKSILKNNEDFKQHRHDQSIFSLIRKKYGSEIINDETYWGSDWETNGKKFPIWAKRIITKNK